MKKGIILAGAIVVILIIVLYTTDRPVTAPDVDTNVVTEQEILDSVIPILDEQAMEQTVTSENLETNEDTSMSENKFENITQAVMKTNKGSITLEFYKEDSPKTVENFLKLASEDFYDGVKFHRVIKDFMIQTGDPLSKDDMSMSLWGTGDPGYKFEDEFNDHLLVQGSLAMANSGPNTNGSQFFIVTAESTPWLDGKHTNFGRVVDGLDVVMAINDVATEGPDRPVDAVVIEGIELK